MRVVIIGTGYVGLTTGVSLAFLGHDVVGVDRDMEKIGLLKRGVSPIHESGIDALLGQVNGRIRFTADTTAVVGDGEVIMIAVGTPIRENGDADISFVEDVARDVAQGLRNGCCYTLVLKSTVPVGTGRRIGHIVEKILLQRKSSASVYMASNPEFLREGNALQESFYPDRIVVGTDKSEAVETLRRLYRPILEQTFTPPSFLPRRDGYKLPSMITSDPTSAEMIKYAANAFLALKISYINEMAGLCERVGADVLEVSRGIGLDPRIGPGFLEAGLGWGGSCFPKDTSALQAMAAEYGYSMPILDAARSVNFRQRVMIIEKLQSALKVVRGRVIAIMGLSFKPDTDDVRESPALDVIRQLLELGAHVRVSDPVAMDTARKALSGLDVEFVNNPYELVAGCDAAVITTSWTQYRQLDLRKLGDRMRTALIIDARNLYSREEASKAGLIYYGVGR